MIGQTHIAEVTNTNDPLKLGRIKVKCPGLVRSDRELPHWIAPSFPFVSKEAVGWFFVPAQGSQVEIEMTTNARGDECRDETSTLAPNMRYRAGLYNDAQQVPSEFKEHYPHRRGVKTPSGHILMFDDSDGHEEVMLKDKSGNSILLTSTGVKILDKSGNYIEWKASGIVAEAAAIKIGAGAADHLVKGESFMNWITTVLVTIFNAHVHPHPMGPTGTTATPLTAPPATVLSTKHMVE